MKKGESEADEWQTNNWFSAPLKGGAAGGKKKWNTKVLAGKLVNNFENLMSIEYSLDNYHRSNQDTCLVHKPSVFEGQWVQSGDLLADCSASVGGELALGQNILIAYMPWEGYNFEDAILISERLVYDDLYTSIHIERYEVEIRETKLGVEEITRDIPDVSEEFVRHLDRTGIAKLGSWVEEGDILIGKVTPINKKTQSNYQKLLYTILEKPVLPIRDSSLRAPKGIKAKVVGIQIFKTPPAKHTLIENKKNLTKSPINIPMGAFQSPSPFPPALSPDFPPTGGTGRPLGKRGKELMKGKEKADEKGGKGPSFPPTGGMGWGGRVETPLPRLNKIENKHRNKITSFSYDGPLLLPLLVPPGRKRTSPPPPSTRGGFSMGPPNKLEEHVLDKRPFIVPKSSPFTPSAPKPFPPALSISPKPPFLPSGERAGGKGKGKGMAGGIVGGGGKGSSVREKNLLNGVSSVQVYLAEKRRTQVGDKMAGRHGNKGIISQILPPEDMPFLPDGTPLDMVLNPLGVPSRMNVGQIYECLLGLAGKHLGENFKVFPFDEIYGPEASRSFVYSKLIDARIKTGNDWLFNPSSPGKMRLYDGRTGESFDQAVTVGFAYMLRLVHMVDDKIHARSTGPYSLVTQQPLRGRSKQGGQRLGEMEVWALEGYGAAFTLLEMLTIKSDDITGRMTLWSNLILNQEISIGTPESFKVLICELQALCLDIDLYHESPSPSLLM